MSVIKTVWKVSNLFQAAAPNFLLCLNNLHSLIPSMKVMFVIFIMGCISQTLGHFLSQIVQLQVAYIGNAHIKEICSISTVSHWVDDYEL